MKKKSLLGHMVKVVNDDPWTSKRGEVVCEVREDRCIEYIVQFQTTWSHFRGRKLKIDE